MGGKAFAGLGNPVRLPTDRMAPIASAICDAVGALPVRWLRNKQDHGDADLVMPQSIVTAMGDERLAATAAAATGHDHFFKRPDVRDPILFVALKVPEGLFQVDLISSPDELADFAVRYLCWGDVGTMIGRAAREMGLTFGQNGLRVPIRIEGVGKESVLLTTDFAEALDLLGWDAAVHNAGFDDDRQSADFLAGGRFFDPKIYDPSRASSEARRRGRVRSGRDSFNEDLVSRPARFDWPAEKGPNPLQDHYRNLAIERFGARSAIDEAEDRLRRASVRLPSVVTREAIVAATGCDPKDFGPIISIIQEDFPGEGEFPAWKTSCSIEDLTTRARAAVPVLAARRLDEERRRAIHQEHERNRQERIERMANGGHFRRNR
jgi:hypothetical protein